MLQIYTLTHALGLWCVLHFNVTLIKCVRREEEEQLQGEEEEDVEENTQKPFSPFLSSLPI